MNRHHIIHTLVLTAGLALGVAATSRAQMVPAIPGRTGTIATKETVDKEHDAARALASRVAGAMHGKGTDRLEGLREGSEVVVHYAGGVTDGTIARLDRSSNRVAIKYGDGTTQEYKVTDAAPLDTGTAVDQPTGGAKHVVVSYTDDQGRKVERHMKRKS
jgi:hypothetical protein